MKNKNLFYNYIKGAAIAALLVSAFVSCKKPEITSENFLAANIAVMNAWNNEDQPDLNFSIDTSKKLHFGVVNYGRQLDYLVVNAGNRTVKFVNTNDGSTAFENPVNLESKKIYSLFLTGTKIAPDVVFVEDDVATEPAVGKYRIRIANMVTDAGSQYELFAAKDGQALALAQKLVSSTTGKSVSAFAEYASGPNPEQRFSVWAINAGKDTLQADRVLLTSQKAYTFTISGGKTEGLKTTSLNSFTNVLPFR